MSRLRFSDAEVGACCGACKVKQSDSTAPPADQEAFSAYLAEYVQHELADDAPGETALGRKLRQGLGQIAGAAGSQLAERSDYGVASVYTIDIAGKAHVFLGVAGQFLPVKGA